MASNSISKPVPVGHNFHYADTKARFYQNVDYVILDKKLQTRVIKRQEDIDKIISSIKGMCHQYRKCFTDKCQVVNVNGKDILCQSTIKFNGETYNVLNLRQILCLDDLFHILVELHMQKPELNETNMLRHLSNCVMYDSFINLFCRSCTACNNDVNSVDVHFRMIGEMTVLKLDSSDGNFTAILLYVERNTNFVLLRPLKSTANKEIAYELLTIFVDFGSPAYLDSDTFFRNTINFKTVLKILQSLAPPFKIPMMYASSRNHKIEVTATKAKAMLQEWMENTGSSNWAIGAHVVQWLMNTNKVVDTYIRSRIVNGPIHSPYHAIYGMLPNTNLLRIKEKHQPDSTMTNEKVLLDCSHCNQPIYKVYKCHFCKSLCHFSCCVRYVEQAAVGTVLINKCFSCANMCVDEVILGT